MLSKWRHYVWCISLLFFVGTVVIWFRTRETMQAVGFKTMKAVRTSKSDYFDESVAVGVGRVWLLHWRGVFGMNEEIVRTYPRVIGERRWYWEERPAWWFKEQQSSGYLGFHEDHFSWGHQGSIDGVDEWTIPVWAVVGVFGVLPITRMAVTVFRRNRANCCIQCSYDLTGNTSGVCPECGTAVKSLAS